MKKVGRKVVSVLLTLCMLLTMLPVSALAADEGTVDTAPAETNLAEPVNTGNSSSDEGETPVSTLVAGTEDSVDYVDEDGQTQTCTEYTTVAAATTTWSNGWYVVTGTVTLDDRVEVSDSVNLILADGAVLNATKGIGVTAGNSLTIYGQSEGTGKLTAEAYQVYNSAAIGGTDDKDQNRNLCAHGDITINGGDITATGASAGIGGGESATGTSGTITINGGTVKATGGSDAAGIGGGYYNYATGGDIIINGGTVNATGGSKAAGIGAGYSGAGGMKITITGGKVTATGGSNDIYGGAGIGANYGGSTNPVSITITGSADVTATGGLGAAGIGGGSGNAEAAVDTIVIDGSAKVHATGGDSDTYGGAGIGAGGNGACGSITIGGSADVTATGGDGSSGSGAGIGAGGFSAVDFGTMTYISNCDVIEITGGTVDATGGSGADGIGGNASSTVESVSISGGTFTENTFPSGEIPADYLADGFAPVKDSNGNWSVEEKEETPPAPTGVAQIGEETYPTLEAAIEAAGENATITLLADVDVGELTKPTADTGLVTIPAGKIIILDLVGHTISGELITDGSTYYNAHVILNNGTLTIMDSSEDHSGAIVNTNTSSHACTRVVKNIEGATLTITGGTITATSGVALLNLGNCSISGDNTVIQALQEGYSGGWNNAVAGIENRTNGVLTISGGSISSASQSALFADGGQATITGGTFTGSAAYGAMNGSPEDYVTVFGGSFSSDPTYVLDQSAYVTQNDEGIYVVQKRSVTEVVVSDENSLLSALNKVTDNTSAVHITISGDVILNTSAKLPLGSTITILRNSFLTIADGVVLTQSGLITNNGTLTVNGFLTNPLNLANNGTLTGLPAGGTEYVVENAMDLQWLTMLFNNENHGITSVKLANDITMPEGVVFESLGKVEGLTFDGQGHTISGITIRGVGGDAGLFVWLGNSVVKNLTLENCDYSTQTGYLGGVVGQANGTTFSNVTVSGKIAATGTSYGVAGIAASVYNSEGATTEFIDCTVNAAVGGQYAYNVGSVFGTASKSYGSIGVYNCTNTGAITAKGSMGYVFGFGYMNSSASLQIIGFDNTGTVNDGAGSISSAAGNGYTYDADYAGSEWEAVKDQEGNWLAQEAATYVAQIGETGYATLREALNKVRDGETIKVLAPATVDTAVTYEITGKTITLNLNGQTVTWNTSAVCAIDVKSGGKLTIQDTSTQKSGALNIISTYATSTANSGIRVNAGGSLNLTGGTVSYYHANKTGYGAIYLNSGSGHQFTMSGGTVKISGYANYGIRMSGGTGTITGGTVEFGDLSYTGTTYGVYVYNATCTIENLVVDASEVSSDKKVGCVYGNGNSSNLTITSGTYTANSNAGSYAFSSGYTNENTIINGGVFDGKVNSDGVTINNGQFSVQPSVVCLPEGKIFKLQDDNYYYVVNGSYVARIGDVGYLDWETLFEAASSGAAVSTIYIMSDANMITVPVGKNVVLNNNSGYTINKIINYGTCRLGVGAMNNTVIENYSTLELRNTVGSVINAKGAVFNVTSTAAAPNVTGTMENHGTMSIAKGTFGGNITSDGSLTITGGTFRGDVTSTGTSNITGGTFATDVKNLCAAGYTTEKNAEGTWNVVKDDPKVAQVDSNQYTSLKAALEAAQNGQTVMLLSDAAVNERIDIYGSITLDMKGHTITYEASSGTSSGIICLWDTAKLTITGNGHFTFEESYLNGPNSNIIDTYKDSELVIENGTFHAGITCVQAAGNSKVVINGGEFSVHTTWEGNNYYWHLNLVDDSNAQIIVSGGTFENYDPANSKTENPVANFCADGYMTTSVVKDGKTYYTVVPAAAEINDTYYATLADAIAAAGDNDTITLLADVTEDVVVPAGKTITLDLNGYKITNAADHTIVNNGTLTITDSSEAKTGTVDNIAHGKGALVNNGTVTLSGGTFERSQEAGTSTGANGNSWYTICNFGQMEIQTGVTVKNKGAFSSMIENGFYGPDVWEEGKTATLTIKGGTFEGGLNTIKNDTYGTLIIEDGTFTNTAQAVVLNWNEATINGGVFTVSGDVAKGCILNGLPGTNYPSEEGGLGEVTITDGSFDAPDGTACLSSYVVNGPVEVSGGTFTEKPDDAYLAEGYAPEYDAGSDTWGVVKDNSVAEIVGGEKYESLIDAVNVAKVSGKTVKLLADVELKPIENQDYVLMIDANQSMTLDLNGHKITATLTNTTEFNLIENYGELTITDSSESQSGSIEVTENGSAEKSRTSVIYNGYSSGEFTLEAGTLKLTGSADSKKPLYGVYSSGIKMVMDGGAIEVRRLNSYSEYSKAWDVYGIYNNSGCQTTVNGGKITVENQGRYNSAYGIYNANGTVSIHGDPNTPYIEANAFDEGTWYEHTLYGNITLYGGKYNMLTDTATGWIERDIIIADGYEDHKNGDGTVSIIKSPVAQIGSTKYDTLEEALKEAKSGDTIKLLQNVALTDRVIIFKNITLNLNDKTISSKADYAFIVNTGNSFTLENGTLSASKNGVFGLTSSTVTLASDATINAGAAGITATNNLLEQGNATINVYGTIHSQDIAVWSQGPKNTINIDSATITSKYFGVYQNGSFGGTTITIKNSTITDESENGTGIYVSNNGTNAENPDQGFQNLIIENSTITGNTAVEVKFTNVTISGDDTCLTATGTPVDSGMNNNGSVTTGYAFAVTHNGTESSKDAAKGTVTISGGKFTGAVGIQEPSEGETTSATISISGGSFSEEPNKDYLAPYYAATQNTPGEGYWTVDVAEEYEATWTKGEAIQAGTLDAMLDAANVAKAGTVALLKNVTTQSHIHVSADVTLDLAGHELDATEFEFTAFGDVVDSTEGEGLLKVAQGSTLIQSSASLPIYDTEQNGYRLFGYQFKSERTYPETVTNNQMGFYFQLTFTNRSAWSLLNTAAETHGIKLSADLQITGVEGSAKVPFAQATIQEVAEQIVDKGDPQENKFFWIIVTSMNKLQDGAQLCVTPRIASDLLEVTAEVLCYPANTSN